MSPSGLMSHVDCPRKWWYEKVAKIRTPSTASQALGTRMHAVVEVRLLEGAWPETGRALDLGRRDGMWCVTSQILEIAAVHEDRLASMAGHEGSTGVEHLIKRAPGDPVFGALPSYMVCDWWDDTPRVVDHKSTKDLTAGYHLTAEGLQRHPQMLMYAAGLWWDDKPPVVQVSHLYYRTQGDPAGRALDTEVTWQQVEDAMGRIRDRSHDMLAHAKVAAANEVPYSRSACGKYGGCPHIAYCPVHQGASPFHTADTGHTMDMKALLAGKTPAAPAPTPASSFAPPDEATPPAATPAPQSTPEAAQPAPAPEATQDTPPRFERLVGLLEAAGGRLSIDAPEVVAAIKADEDVSSLRAKRKMAYLSEGHDAGHWDNSASEVWLLDTEAEADAPPAEADAPPAETGPLPNLFDEDEAAAPRQIIMVGCRDIDMPAMHLDDLLGGVYAKVQREHSVPDWATMAYGAGKGLVFAAATQPSDVYGGVSLCEAFVGVLYVRPRHPMCEYLRRMFPTATFYVASDAEV